MRRRCYLKTSQRYYTHGARGINVCPEWINSFETFLGDMGIKPGGKTLDRIDNDKGYSKENCRWATPKEQANNRRTCVVVEGKNITEWSSEINLSNSAIAKRLKKGKPLIADRFWKQTVTAEILDQAIQMRKEGMTQQAIGDHFGVCQSAVYKWFKKHD